MGKNMVEQLTTVAYETLINKKANTRRGKNQEVLSLQNPRYELVTLNSEKSVKPKHILVIAPHFDDEEFTASTMMQIGGETIISYAYYTDGREGAGPYSKRYGLTPEQLITKRVQEQTNSMSRLASINSNIQQVNIFQSYDMQLARYYEEAIVRTVEFCRKFGVDLIVFPNPTKDYHPDHLAAGQIGLATAKNLNITAYSHDTQFGKKWIIPPGFSLGEVYQQMNTSEYFQKLLEQNIYYEGDVLVTIPPHIMLETLNVLRMHVSQMARTDFLSRILKSKVIRGQWAGINYAETFSLAHQSTKEDGVIHPFSLLLPGSVYRLVAPSNLLSHDMLNMIVSTLNTNCLSS